MKVKTLATIIGLILTLLTAGVGYGKLQDKAENTKGQVEKIEKEVKEQDKRINDEENINIRQSVIQERTIDMLDKLEQRMYERNN